MNVLVINCGSSSVKYRLFRAGVSIADGKIERIGEDFEGRIITHKKALQQVLDALEGLQVDAVGYSCLLYTSPSPRDKRQSRMPSSA